VKTAVVTGLSTILLCLLLGGCGPKLTEIYRYAGGARPAFEPDKKIKVEWIKVAKGGPVTIYDGPMLEDGRYLSSMTFHEGGLVGFVGGENRWLKPISVKYLGEECGLVE
jgi:hypothetical protein